ncbi:hypothetical protein BC628DRAFT_239504 [Trametes gibbosa]|nr:hypothetical protein BC628DRAFT_239504 [Trametes gibbosa]
MTLKPPVATFSLSWRRLSASTPTSGCYQMPITTFHDPSRPYMNLHAGTARSCSYLYSSSFAQYALSVCGRSWALEETSRNTLLYILCSRKAIVHTSTRLTACSQNHCTRWLLHTSRGNRSNAVAAQALFASIRIRGSWHTCINNYVMHQFHSTLANRLACPSPGDDTSSAAIHHDPSDGEIEGVTGIQQHQRKQIAVCQENNPNAHARFDATPNEALTEGHGDDSAVMTGASTPDEPSTMQIRAQKETTRLVSLRGTHTTLPASIEVRESARLGRGIYSKTALHAGTPSRSIVHRRMHYH